MMYLISALTASEHDLDLHEVDRETASRISMCNRLPETRFWATKSENMILFHEKENGFNLTTKVDNNGVATRAFTDQQMYSHPFLAARYWG